LNGGKQRRGFALSGYRPTTPGCREHSICSEILPKVNKFILDARGTEAPCFDKLELTYIVNGIVVVVTFG
jgi:hypothetical protein